MWNVLTLAGGIIMILGGLLSLSSLVAAIRAGARWWRSRKPPADGMWGMAQSASEVYVPGSVKRKLGLGLVGILIIGLGAPLAWAGRELRDFGLARSPLRLGALWVEGKGTKLVVKPEGGVSDGYVRPGLLLVAHVEYLGFPDWLGKIGLGPYFRLTQIGGYDSSLQVLQQRGRGRIEIQNAHPLFLRLEWIASRVPKLGLEVRRRFSVPLPDGGDHAEIWAVPSAEVGSGGELEWRR